jgi:histidinol-phosphate phosphatase family protein
MIGACDVVILAGGQGTRLRERAGNLPKPMVPLLGRPILDYQLDLCRAHGCRRVLLLVHYGHEAIRALVGDGARHGISVEYAVETAPRGTAGALRDALPRLADTFLVLYGDTYLDVDLRRMREAHAQSRADAALFVHPNDHPQDSDLVEIDDAGFVAALHPYPHAVGAEHDNLVNAALYVMRRAGLEPLIPAEGKADLAKDLFPQMLHAGRRLLGYVSPEYIKDVGTPDRLDRVAADIEAGVPDRLSARALRSAVFLDRDGTLNDEVEYLSKPEQIALLPGVTQALQRVNRSGHLAVVVTNQSVVARGDVTLARLKKIHTRLTHLLGAGHAYVDRIYMCPHHPDRGFPGEVAELKQVCSCRKPETGMVDEACRDLQIDRRTSWIVGDTTSDMETGRRAGLRTVLVRTGHAGQDGKFSFRPDYVVPDLAAAVAWILDGYPAMRRRMAPVADAARQTRLVMIGGLARSGKSSAAQVLREMLADLGRTAHIFPLDSWLKPVAERTEGTGVASRFDLDAMRTLVVPLLQLRTRASVSLPIYDRTRRASYDRRVELSIDPDDVIVVEGVPALLIEGLSDAAGVRVHLETPEDERVSRLRADYRWRGESDAAVDGLVASRTQDETSPVLGARSRAEFIVDAWTPHDPQ